MASELSFRAFSSRTSVLMPTLLKVV